MEKQFIMIAGCGRMGAAIAERFSDQKLNCIVMDQDRQAFLKLSGSYGGLTVNCSCTDLDKLTEAGIGKANVFLAVTNSDCVNICAAQIAKCLFHVERVVARIYDNEMIPLLEKYGIEAICPAELTEKEIATYVKLS